MFLSTQFELALTLAHQLHARQERKGSGVPYIAHLLGVASLVLDYGGDEETAIAALLHDTIEDCGSDHARQAIYQTLGRSAATQRILAIVEACSDSDQTPKPPWLERKTAYIARLATFSASARLVTSADKLHNARSLLRDYRQVGEKLWLRFAGKKMGTLWYYRAVHTALQQVEDTPILQELDRVITELEKLVGSATSASPP